MLDTRLRCKSLHSRIVSAEEASDWIQDGMVIGLSGFTRAGDAKAVPLFLAKNVKSLDRSPKVDIYTGASLGHDIDGKLAEAGLIGKRLPFQADPIMRHLINKGELLFVDQHLSQMAESIRNGDFPPIDLAIIEAVAITEKGHLVPSTSVGNNLQFVKQAKQIIVELNLAQPTALEGMHDIYEPGLQGSRQPIPLRRPEQRIGEKTIPVDPEKIRGVVITEMPDSPSPIKPSDEETQLMANHLIRFLREEVAAGRLPDHLLPLQSGIGTISNAVLHGFLNLPFGGLTVYSEVLQDAVFDLIDAGIVSFASGCSLTLSPEKKKHVFSRLDFYKDRVVLRPQEISNHPEVIRRLGVIALNTALEADIYGNINSTHVLGTKMMNGIGGSGDFARNARLSIFATKSTAKGGTISSIVPFVSHTDHSEHDVDVLVTEQGLADLRGLAPRERAKVIIENCTHPDYRPQLRAYFEEALLYGGQTPHVLEKALSWHIRFQQEGTMLECKGKNEGRPMMTLR